MYKFDNSIPLKELSGQEIIQVCFGVHDIIVRFGSGQSISIFAKSTFYETNGWDFLFGNSIMLSLVGSKIIDIFVDSPSSAQAIVQDGTVIKLVDSPLNLESFVFSLSSGEYVI